MGSVRSEHPLNWDCGARFDAALGSMRHSPTLRGLFQTGGKGWERGWKGGSRSSSTSAFNLGDWLQTHTAVADVATVYATLSLVDLVLTEECSTRRAPNYGDESATAQQLGRARRVISSIRRTYWNALEGMAPLGHSLGDAGIAERRGWMPPGEMQTEALSNLMRYQEGRRPPRGRNAVASLEFMASLGLSSRQSRFEMSDRPCVTDCQTGTPTGATAKSCNQVGRVSLAQGALGCAVRICVDHHLRDDVARWSSQDARGRVEEARTLLCLLLGTPHVGGPTTLTEAVRLMDPQITNDVCLQLSGMELGAFGREGLDWSRWRLWNYSRCLALRWVFHAPADVLGMAFELCDGTEGLESIAKQADFSLDLAGLLGFSEAPLS